MTSPVQRVVLVSIDGWGVSDNATGNAIANAVTPNMTAFMNNQPTSQPPAPVMTCLIDASGLSVGLPKGVMGNSEVGHLTMGAGRVEFQDLVRINQSIEDNTFASNPRLQAAFNQAKSGNGRVHFLGLVSDGGVHSHINHLERLLEAAKASGVNQSFIHFFADGRDTKPTSGTGYIKRVIDFTDSIQYGKIATVVGRYFAMDRDKRWERVGIAYDMLTGGVGESVEQSNLINFIETKRYVEAKENDEFLKPIIVDSNGLIQDGDVLVFFDFRSDRMREITSLFAEPNDDLPFASKATKVLNRASVSAYIMTRYDETWTLPIIFPPQSSKNGLSEWISLAGLKQFHTAETEKYAHVTFFFNGGREISFEGEDRGLIPSPKVPTYDHAPEMSMTGVADSVIDAINKGNHQFIMCNFAAPDMVGHTGVYDAAVVACTACDREIGRIADACKQHGYHLIITADHGNAEEMLDAEGKPKTSHTTNYIPFIVQVAPGESRQVKFIPQVETARSQHGQCCGGLSDVAPSVLALMGLPIPAEMTGHSLLEAKSA